MFCDTLLIFENKRHILISFKIVYCNNNTMYPTFLIINHSCLILNIFIWLLHAHIFC